MADGETRFEYVAIDAAGRKLRGALAAPSEAAAFERLRREGLSPLRLRRAKARKLSVGKVRTLSERETAELLADLAALLRAGADMRGALAIIGARSGRASTQAVCRALSAEISGGGALDRAFGRWLPPKRAFISALVAAGEAGGDLPGGFERAATILESRIQLREQLVSVLSYPVFVFFTSLVALGVILLLVVPSLAPLAQAPGAEPGLPMRVLLALSNVLGRHLVPLSIFTTVMALGLFACARAGLLAATIEPLLFDGPTRRTAGGIVFGAFAVALGGMLAAGAPISEALRLALRSVKSGTARARLEPVVNAVRQGETLSSALGRVRGFPASVVRLAAVGEASGALGVMLTRAGKLEEGAALRRIEAAGRLLGPALIVLLGGLLGLLMAGLLSGVTGLGESALH